MQRCLLLIVFVIFLVSCSSPTAIPTPAPQPTYTPLPTYTPYPTGTPESQPTSQVVARPISPATPKPTAQPQAIASPSSSASPATCIAWTDASAHLDEATCVRGTVYSASLSGSTFFINFDNTRTSFYSVSFNYTWDNLKGKCVEITGKISPYNGRPQIVIDKKDQLKECK